MPPEAREAAALLQAAGAALALVTSKTLEEARIYAYKLGLRPRCPGYLIVAEEGAAAEASNPALLPPSGRLQLAEPLTPAEALSLLPPGCRGEARSIDAMSPRELEALTGLPPAEASAARERRYVAAIHAPRRCLEEGLREALRRRLYARLGRAFLMVGRVPGKAAALREALRASPHLRGARLVAVGDSPMDEEMLEHADEAIVVPGPRGPRASPRRGDYLVAPTPAPAGWVWAARLILARHASGLAPTC